jgi:hypothetical protein
MEPEWNDDGTLTVFKRTDPFVIHPRTGKKLYRSVLHVFNTQKGLPGENAELAKALRKRKMSERSVPWRWIATKPYGN